MAWDVAALRHQLGSPVEATDADTDARESTAQKPPLLEREVR